MATKLTILGSGTSHGVPMIDCHCPVCTSADPRDRRTRTSAVFSYDVANLPAASDIANLLVDTGPELRLQCIANRIRRVDAILYTHHHADHIVGLDDMRRFNWLQKTVITAYGNQHTIDHLRQMFRYAFEDDPEYPSAKPQLETRVLTGPVELFGRVVMPIPYFHGRLEVLGYRVGAIAYCPDCNFIPDESLGLLRGLDVLVLDALRRTPHPTHFNLDQAVEQAARIGAARTYFTHIAHELGHAATNAELPRGMELAYDGLVVESD